MTTAKRAVQCPACRARLTVSADSTAARIRCATCDTVFPAAMAIIPPSAASAPPKSKGNWLGWIVLGTTLLMFGGCVALVATSPNTTSTGYTPPPGVSDTDAAFLKAVHKEGITSSRGDQAMIDDAHTLCLKLATGESVDGIAEHWGLTSEKMSTDSARFFVRTAAAAYCPRYP